MMKTPIASLGRRSKLAWLVGASALVIAATDVAPAFAEVEEITVTARKREEALQDVPIAIQAFSAKQVEKFAAADLTKIGEMATQVFLLPGASGQGASFRVRGIGNPALDPGLESSVAVNIDGMQIDRGHIVRQGFFDLQSVQVLKGPQALFFGKNSPGGVVALTGALPGDEFEGKLQLGYEFEAKEVIGEMVLSGPVTDKLGVRLAVRGSHMEGYLKNNALPLAPPASIASREPYTLPGRQSERNGADRNLVARLTLDYNPTPEFNATFRLLGTTYDTENFATLEVISCTGPQPVTNANIGAPMFDPYGDCKLNGVVSHGSIPPEISAGYPGTERKNGKPFGSYDSFLATLNMQWKLPNVTLSSMTGHYWFDYNRWDNFDGTVYSQLQGVQIENQHQTAQEIRALTTFDGPFNFMLGGFFDTFNRQSDNRGKIFPLGAAPGTGFFHTWSGTSQVKGSSWAVFGQAIINVTPELELAGGVRYSHDSKEADQGNTFVNPNTLPAGPLTGVPLALVILKPAGIRLLSSFDDGNVSPEATVTWKPTTDLTFYGAYRTGYKAGGFSTNTVVSASATGASLTFEPEKAKGGEIGMKSTLLDGTLRLNINVYRYTFENLQVSAFDAATTSFQIRNAAAARTTGVEVESEWQPMEALTVRGNMGYNRGIYTEFTTSPCYSHQTVATGCVGGLQDLSGKPLNFAPKWTSTIGVDYNLPAFQDGIMLGLSGEAIYTSSYETMSTNNPIAVQDGFIRGNARVSIFNNEETWELAVIARNVANKLYLGGCADKPGGFAGGTDIFCQTIRGREVIFQGTFKF